MGANENITCYRRIKRVSAVLLLLLERFERDTVEHDVLELAVSDLDELVRFKENTQAKN